jgi:hypothetical protein
VRQTAKNFKKEILKTFAQSGCALQPNIGWKPAWMLRMGFLEVPFLF